MSRIAIRRRLVRRQPVDRGLGFRHVTVGRRDRTVSPPETRRSHAPSSTRLANNWSTACAPDRYGLVAISTPSPLPGDNTLSTIGNSPGCSPGAESSPDLGQQLCPRSRSAPRGGAAAQRPACTRARASAISSPDRSAIRSASSISRSAASSGSKHPNGIASSKRRRRARRRITGRRCEPWPGRGASRLAIPDDPDNTGRRRDREGERQGRSRLELPFADRLRPGR